MRRIAETTMHETKRLQGGSVLSAITAGMTVLLLGLGGSAWSADDAPAQERSDTATQFAQAYGTAMPRPLEEAQGELTFEGLYRHSVGGVALEGLEHRWIKQQENSLHFIGSDLPFMNAQCYVEGGRVQGLRRYEIIPAGGTGTSLKMEFDTGKVWVTLRDGGLSWDRKEFTMPARALFDPTSSPDPYGIANVMGEILTVPLRSPEVSPAYDWNRAGDGFADYRVRVRNAGLEQVTVPCGTFRANHMVLEQLSNSDTRFTKEAGDITDVWMLYNSTILRAVRSRDQYVVELVDWKILDAGSNLVERTAVDLNAIAPVALPPEIAPEAVPLTDAARISGCWTDRGFKMPYKAALYLTAYRGEAGGVSEFGIGDGEGDCQLLLRSLPKNPKPRDEIFAGEFEKDEIVPFCLKTTWREVDYWVSTSMEDYASQVTFHDADGSSNGREGAEQIAPDKWLLQLDDANSYKYDDDDNDIPIVIRLEAR